MADDVTAQSTTLATIPSGTVIATDDVGGKHYQKVKLYDPTADSSTALIGQKARTGSMPMALSTEDAALLADLLTITAFQARVPTNGQKTMAGSLPVVLPSDQSAIPVTLTSTTITSGTITIGAALPSGTNAIGKLAANSGVDIGDVDVTSLPALPAGTNNIGDVDVLTLPSLPAGTNNIGDVDVLTLPALPAGTNNIGDVDVLSVVPGIGATNLGKAEDAAHTSGDTGVMSLAVRNDTAAALSGTSGDYEPLQTDANGSLRVVSASYATTVSATLTRPADTTAYAANDEVSNSTTAPTILTFSNMARISSGAGYITDALCIDSANQATKGQFELWLFDTTHTPDNDNAAFTPSDTEAGNVVAIVPFNVWYPGDDTSGAGGNAIATYSGSPISYLCSGSANLFGRVKVKNAYTPVSAEALTFKLKVRRD